MKSKMPLRTQKECLKPNLKSTSQRYTLNPPFPPSYPPPLERWYRSLLAGLICHTPVFSHSHNPAVFARSSIISLLFIPCQQASRESRLSVTFFFQSHRGNVCCGNIWLCFCITKPAEADVILLCCGTRTNQMVNDYDTCIAHGYCSRNPVMCVCVCVSVYTVCVCVVGVN